MQDTRKSPSNFAVLLTPQGAGAIAVVRLHGPLNADFVRQHFSRPAKVGRCVHGDLRDGDETIDDVVVVQTENGAIDVNAHGGPWVTQAVLNLAKRFGYAIESWAAVGDLSLDAADEIERQVLLDLPAARSKAVLRLLTAQPAAWRAMLAGGGRAAIQAALGDRALEIALSTPTVAIVGPPNVGKSTLANALFGQARSITADVPGTTRDWVGELADLDGLVVRLIDTPGVRATADPIEAAAIERAGPVMAAARCVVLVIDGSVATDAVARDAVQSILRNARSNGQSVVPVFSKADLPEGRANPCGCLRVSGATGVGIAALRTALRAALGATDLTTPTARCWTTAQRQRLESRLGNCPATPAAGI